MIRMFQKEDGSIGVVIAYGISENHLMKLVTAFNNPSLEPFILYVPESIDFVEIQVMRYPNAIYPGLDTEGVHVTT